MYADVHNTRSVKPAQMFIAGEHINTCKYTQVTMVMDLLEDQSLGDLFLNTQGTEISTFYRHNDLI